MIYTWLGKTGRGSRRRSGRAGADQLRAPLFPPGACKGIERRGADQIICDQLGENIEVVPLDIFLKMAGENPTFKEKLLQGR
jgi:hypothetical protein